MYAFQNRLAHQTFSTSCSQVRFSKTATHAQYLPTQLETLLVSPKNEEESTLMEAIPYREAASVLAQPRLSNSCVAGCVNPSPDRWRWTYFRLLLSLPILIFTPALSLLSQTLVGNILSLSLMWYFMYYYMYEIYVRQVPLMKSYYSVILIQRSDVRHGHVAARHSLCSRPSCQVLSESLAGPLERSKANFGLYSGNTQPRNLF